MPGGRTGGGGGSGVKGAVARVRQAVTKKTQNKKQQKEALRSPTTPRPKVQERQAKKEAAKVKKDTRKAEVAEESALKGDTPSWVAPRELERRKVQAREAERAEKEDRFT
ncbi:hypothetical protein CLAFUW4_05278 [Fulvia fulva]|nr:hypothetical protein CLAFUR4_05272 [Fulvia fulva]WPV15155.1 hypothetical protein CLAFUW4_05278 [Fulvia fulva]WPV29983.1 hypothetical protein CLAFUW7_05277 [Fulvia fulva]